MGQPAIVDTNVLINNIEILKKDNIIIPYKVLEELDKLKKDKYIGYKVREVVRQLMNKNIKCKEYKTINDKLSTDDTLIRIGLREDVKIITGDYLLYKKAETKGVNVELYQPNNEIYSGVVEYHLTNNLIEELYSEGKIKYNGELYENQFLDSEDIVCRYNNGYLYKIDWNKTVNGLDKPTRRQLMALDVLYDENIRLVSMFGKQGVGKSTLALNSAVEQVMDGKYDKIYISRPKKSRNIDEGFAALPGELEEKYAPYNAPFYDVLYTQTALRLETLPLSSIQGRNLNNSIWIITEAQDISPKDTKLIVGRCAKGTKLILEGDLENQFSDKSLNKYNNGLTHVINTFRNSNITATIKLDEVKRSELAELACQL